MKSRKIVTKIISFALVAVILATNALAAAGGTGEAKYSNTLTISDGFTYINEISYNASNQRVESFAVETDGTGDVYPIVVACDTIYGGMTIDEVIKYAESEGYNVLGAVNSDFFSMSTKVPIGAVIEDGIYKSSPEGENMLVFSDEGAYVSLSPDITVKLLNNGKTEIAEDGTEKVSANAGKVTKLTHFNKKRVDSGGLYLFTEDFSTVSTRSTSAGWAVKMAIVDGDVSVGKSVELEVTEVIEHGTEYTIGEGYVVLTAADDCGMREEIAKYAVGDRITMTIETNDEKLVNAKWATGCGDLLVNEGEVTDADNWDSALFGYNPRTAVGIKEDGGVIYYVVDGRSTSYSNGAKMSQIATDMIAMGCKYVVNMDGGGSSAMALKLPGSDSATVINSPCLGYNRSCSTYILFVTDSISDGEPQHLYIEQDGDYVLLNSKLNLKYLSFDSGYTNVTAPDDITVTPTTGTVEDGVYTAVKTGKDNLTLSSSSGAVGSGTLHVVSSVDSVTIKNKATNKTPVFTSLKEGTTIQLSIALTKYSRNVYFDNSCVTYEITGDAGTITEDGLFTAGKAGSSGTLTVTVAGVSKKFDISVKNSFEDIVNHWSKDYVEMLYSEGIVNGTSGSTFSPNAVIRRGDFVLMLWRAMGKPEATGELTFTDVPATSYYAEAIKWAENAGVANGVGDGKFSPDGTLTREQAFTLVYRAYFESAGDEIDTSILSPFTDWEKVSGYAVTATSDLVLRGIISGSNGKLSPKDEITRGEMAKILCMVIYSQNDE